jgi:hypothetical protein
VNEGVEVILTQHYLARQAPRPAGCHPGLPGPRRGLGLRQGAVGGNDLHHRGAAAASGRINAIRELAGKYGWITALRAPAIRKLMADDGPLQLSLFDEQDLAEISSPGFPDERLIACRNPVLADERGHKREPC